ncbi:MAG: ice-binding family protein [Planctomycetota bacterium]
MTSKKYVLPVLVLALVSLVFAGCKRSSDGGSSSSGNTSSGSGSSGSGSKSAVDPVLIPPPPAPPKPDLGVAYFYAALAYYYLYHKKDTVVWGDVGANWGDYDNEDYSSVMTDGYTSDGFGGYVWPTFKEATIFGDEHYSYSGSTAFPSGDPTGYAAAMLAATLCYTDLAGRTPTVTRTDLDLSGETLTAGIYKFDSTIVEPVTGHIHKDVTLGGGTLTLSGSSTDTWIFQIPGNLYARGKSKVVMTGGALPENVWWQVGVAIPSGDYRSTGPDLGPYGYTYDNMPGAFIGDDEKSPPWKDPDVTGYANFIGTVLVNGDVQIGAGSNVTGRVASLYYGWWYYATNVYGSISIGETGTLALGSASDPDAPANFAALAYDSMTNTGDTLIKGSAGVATGIMDPGTPPFVVEAPGTFYPDSGTATDPPDDAVAAALLAQVDALARDADYSLKGYTLLGKRLPGGVYLIDSFAFTGDPKVDGPITLDGRNDPGSVWIFRHSGALDIVSALGVFQFKYERGANADNVIWISDTFSLGASTNFRGTILATAASPTAIVLGSDSVVQGRVIATSGSITLSNNTIFSDSTGGLLVTGFGTGGVIQSEPGSSTKDEARSVATEGSFLYVFGYEGGMGTGVNNTWRVERRMLSDGSLVGSWPDGTGLLKINPAGAIEMIPRKILVNATHMFLFGSQETTAGSYDWRVEKRVLTTGVLDTAFDVDGVYTTTTANGKAGDIALHTDGFLYAVGDDDIAGMSNIRVEKLDATTGASSWVVTQSSFWNDIEPHSLPTTDCPAAATCVTIADGSEDFLIIGGWLKDSVGDTGSTRNSMLQKRRCSDGSLDVYIESVNPGFGFSGQGTYRKDNGITLYDVFTGTFTFSDDSVHSVVTDGTHLYALTTYRTAIDYPYWVPPSIFPGFDNWALLKVDVATAESPVGAASMYLLGSYLPPSTPSVADFGCGQLVLDTNRLFIAGSNRAPLDDLLWRIEKRKSSSFAFDSLFNTEGAQPGLIESDPSFGVPGVPEMWKIYDSTTGAYVWVLTDPAPATVYEHRAAIPPIIGMPDRAWAVTTTSGGLGKVFIVGSDGTDLPSKLGQWRIECRNK